MAKRRRIHAEPGERRRFRIWREYWAFHGVTLWRWECSLCDPITRGGRFGVGGWQKIVAISLPHHMRVRRCHHQFVERFYAGS